MKQLYLFSICFLLILFGVSSLSAQPPFWGPANFSLGSITTTNDGKIFVSSYKAGLLYSPDNGNNWTNLGLIDHDLRQVAINPSGDIFVSASGDGAIFRSTDGGNTWVKLDSNRAVRTIKIKSNGTIFAGVYVGGMLRSTDNGNSWAEINNGISPSEDMFDILVNDSGHVFIATGQDGIFKSTNDGDDWISVNDGITFFNIATLEKNSNGEIFAGTWDTGEIFRTPNNGQSWVKSDSGIKANVCMGIATYDNQAFATTDSGVFRSTDYGRIWESLNDGIGGGTMQKVSISSNGYVFVTTSAGGLYKSPLITGVQELGNQMPSSITLRQNYPNPFNPNTNIEYQIAKQGNVEIGVYDINGRLVRSLLNTSQHAGSYTIQWNGQDENGGLVSSGTYFYQVKSDGVQLVKKMLMLK